MCYKSPVCARCKVVFDERDPETGEIVSQRDEAYYRCFGVGCRRVYCLACAEHMMLAGSCLHCARKEIEKLPHVASLLQAAGFTSFDDQSRKKLNELYAGLEMRMEARWKEKEAELRLDADRRRGEVAGTGESDTAGKGEAPSE